MIYEVCVDSVEGALAAQAGGAQRVELCANLLEGGITPSIGTIALTHACLSIGLHVLLRPRGGDFLYSETEKEVMRQDLLAIKQQGANGIVTGALLVDGQIDHVFMAELLALARPLSVTFHRAFDLCRDPYEALEILMDLGVDRILTSGQQRSAWQGAGVIAELVQRASDRLIILVGGGVRASQIARLQRRTGAQEFHFSARRSRDSAMLYQNPLPAMGKATRNQEYLRRETDALCVRQVIEALEPAPHQDNLRINSRNQP